MSKKAKIIIIVSLCCLLIIGGVVAFLLIKGKSPEAASGSDYSYNSFTEGFTSVRVTDEESAIEAVESVSASLGIANAQDELKVKTVHTLDNDSYYKIQQYHKGIAVYGRNIVVAADGNGEAACLTSNYKQISENLDLEPSASEEKIVKAIKKYFNAEEDIELDIGDDDLVIYTMNGYENLAYLISSTDYGTIIVDADSAEILHYDSVLSDVSARVQSKDGKVTSTGWRNDDGSHHLYNQEHKIAIFDLEGENSEVENASGEKGVYIDIRSYEIDTMYSENNVFDKNALILLNDIISLTDYYEDLGFEGFDQIHAAINDGFDWGENACGAGNIIDDRAYSTMFFGSKYKFPIKDITAHEFTHSVSKILVGWSGGSVENDAINEAYSDIFGVLYENSDDPDWLIKTIRSKRYLYSPNKNKYFDHVSDMSKSKKYDKYKVSTIVSHAAYLMWNGIDGTASQLIGAEELTELWYRSMYLLPSDANLSQCRNAVELSARIMLRNGDLTQKQYNTVVEAFERVGIDVASFTYNETVKNKFDLSVLNSENTDSVKYNLEIIKIPVIEPGFNLTSAKYKTVIKEKGVFGEKTLDLEDGTYIMRLTDSIKDNKTQKTISVKLVVDGDNPDASDNLTVNTDFSSVLIVMVPAGDNKDIYALLDRFEGFCNKADISGILDSIVPEVSDNIRMAFEFMGAFSDVSQEEIMDYITMALTSEQGLDGAAFLSSINIDPNSVTESGSYAYANCDVSFVVDGEALYMEASFLCEKRGDGWYISSLEFN